MILPKCEELTDPSTECCPIGFQKMATSTRISPSRQFGRFSERGRFSVKQVSIENFAGLFDEDLRTSANAQRRVLAMGHFRCG